MARRSAPIDPPHRPSLPPAPLPLAVAVALGLSAITGIAGWLWWERWSAILLDLYVVLCG
jgi:hypothetical protein